MGIVIRCGDNNQHKGAPGYMLLLNVISVGLIFKNVAPGLVWLCQK